MGSFDAFSLDQSSAHNGHMSDGGEPAPRSRLRARRRNSLGAATGGTSLFAPTTGFNGFGDFDGGSKVPSSSSSADGTELGNVSQRPPRRRARRSSIGHAGADAVANFVSSSHHTRSMAPVDYGYGDPAQAAEQYGYEDHMAPSNGFSADFGTFGGERKANIKRRSSFAGNVDCPKTDTRDKESASYQRKLIDDINFSTDFGAPETKSTQRRASMTGNTFTLPMTETTDTGASSSENAARGGERRPRRRASLIGSSFANHQVLELDSHESEQKQQNKSFFKDRSNTGGADRNPKANHSRSNENLAGYDFDRDRRRFMG